jgi:hypothetical protein
MPEPDYIPGVEHKIRFKLTFRARENHAPEKSKVPARNRDRRHQQSDRPVLGFSEIAVGHDKRVQKGNPVEFLVLVHHVVELIPYFVGLGERSRFLQGRFEQLEKVADVFGFDVVGDR